MLASFQKLCPGIKTPKKEEPIVSKSEADLFEKKKNELVKSNRVVDEVDAHYVKKNAFSLRKFMYLLRTSTEFNHPSLLDFDE